MKLTNILFVALGLTLALNACKSDADKNEANSQSDSVKVNINGVNSDSLLNEINAVEKKLFAEKKDKIESTIGLQAIKVYTDFINQFPEDKRVPEYLFKAGEISSALNLSDAAIGYFQNLYTKFPENEKAVFAMFIHAFILENQLMDLEKAKAKYQEVIDKFPGTQQATDAKASIEHLGKSPEDLIKEFEAKNKK
ncbi:MAG: tetratricopeptide repeat protein [Bacteroidota bacterium]